MQWRGKLIGTLVGFVAGPVGAAVGAIFGHGYDLADAEAAASEFLATLFAVMGYLAKLDGRVSEASIAAALATMRRLKLSDAQCALARSQFEGGKRAGYPLAEAIVQLRARFKPRHELLRLFVRLELDAALAGQSLSAAVCARLLSIARALGFSAAEFSGLEAEARAQAAGAGAFRAAQGESVGTAYAILGLQPSASDEAVKLAYRRQMNDHHPDKLKARGLPESMQELAKERTQRIREAYEAIAAHRGLR